MFVEGLADAAALESDKYHAGHAALVGVDPFRGLADIGYDEHLAQREDVSQLRAESFAARREMPCGRRQPPSRAAPEDPPSGSTVYRAEAAQPVDASTAGAIEAMANEIARHQSAESLPQVASFEG